VAPRRVRLDVALVQQGLEESRERARRLIVAGEVTVNGEVARAPSSLVPEGAVLAVGKRLPYVSRGGLKLAHALDRFWIDPAGLVALDAGASTGGFTDCLLQRGARRVFAVDVGKGLLAWTLRQDPRVVVLEGRNVRYLVPGDLPQQVDLATVDVAFISLRLVLPAIAGATRPGGDVVALVKPQFEAGAAEVGKGGVVRDPAVHRRVLEGALHDAREAGLVPAGLTASPIRGEAGNVEFLLWARRPAEREQDSARAGAPALPELDGGAALEGALVEAAALALPGRGRA
jgi:23S rRNA (cytidine1920-2'-O)/16S rRNA (cytidine1409-2'-O)-methyltransferase